MYLIRVSSMSCTHDLPRTLLQNIDTYANTTYNLKPPSSFTFISGSIRKWDQWNPAAASNALATSPFEAASAFPSTPNLVTCSCILPPFNTFSPIPPVAISIFKNFCTLSSAQPRPHRDGKIGEPMGRRGEVDSQITIDKPSCIPRYQWLPTSSELPP